MRSFIVCDLEATDKIPSCAQILTGCFLHCDEDLNVMDTLEIQSRPQIWDRFADESVQIHGITKEVAMRFPSWKKTGLEVVSWLKSKPTSHFVCHSNRTIFGKFSTYDYSVLKMQLLDLDLHWDLYRTCPESMILSTHSIAKHLDVQMGFGGSLNLKSISDRLGLKEFDHHNATADAHKCLEILRRLLPKIDLENFLNKEYFKTIGEENDHTHKTDSTRKRKPRKPQITEVFTVTEITRSRTIQICPDDLRLSGEVFSFDHLDT